ncbi:condensation domain-containing protein [Actinosynnema sp. NPDC047251]|uniref:Condensation domain-containing protein n=1 Tax=Saccharothrix espanaensis (strain ATCC 51144 / DSM 44229 / JCM 9112 / NBRC 15066 / NRRL 15764) TaxID=1179773 RepID=K0JXY0_SACES|nr:condensation domain-containing protein [Saccharothrix espanaensis]CCH29559.1 Condensation domain-containing protein [Saccharothrix espanaensis DSM 44229]
MNGLAGTAPGWAGDVADPATVPDDHWTGVPAFGLLDPADRALVPAGAVDAFPMTGQQVAMATQLVMGNARRRKGAAGVPPYHNVAMSRLSVPAVDLGLFVACGEALAARHEMFRSALDLDTYSVPMQIVFAEPPEPLVTVHDLRRLDEPGRTAELDRFAAAENARTLSLRDAPLTRFTVHVLTDHRITLTITEPHAIADGWSTHLNFIEYFDTYVAALGNGGPVVPPPPSFRLRFHSAQQRCVVRSGSDLDWWREQLAPWTTDATGSLRHGTTVSAAWHTSLTISGSECEALLDLARASGVGLKTVLLTVHLTALHRIPGAAGTLTGMTVNTRLAVEDGVDARGMFLNVVPLPRRAEPVDAVAAPADVHREVMQVTARGRVPLAHLVREFGRGVAPQSLFVFNSFHSVAGAAERMGIDTFEQVSDWSRTDFPFEASFNRSEEATNRIDLQLYSDGRFADEPTAVAAYRAAVRGIANRAVRVRHG